MKYRHLQSIVLLSVCLCAGQADAQVDRSKGGPVSEADFSSRYTLQSARPENLSRVRDPAGSSRTVLRARVHETDEKVFGGRRTEIIPLNEYIREGVRWYAISAYFPHDWQFHAYPTIIGQLHTSQHKVILSPPLAFVVNGRYLNLELYANHRTLEGGESATRANSSRQLIRLDRIETERWYCFVIRADWSSLPGQGNLKVWLNGDRVYEGENAYNAYESRLGNYPKAGIYMTGMMGVPERSLFFDFIHLGGPRSSMEEMAAQTPCG